MEVRWLTFARKQLGVVIQYVNDQFGSNTAKHSLQSIMKSVNGLMKFPDSGVWDKKFSTENATIRHLNVGPNVVYYLVDLDEVVIIAVMHCRQSPNTVNRTICYVLSSFNEELYGN